MSLGGRSLLLSGEINEKRFATFAQELAGMVEEPGPISLMVNCRGGELMAGFALHDAILAAQAAGSPITGYVFGRCASMATVVYQACETRLMAPNAWLHIHAMSYSMDNVSIDKHREELRENDELEARCYRILARRSIYTARGLRNMVEGHEYTLSATEAVRKGFADGVVRFPQPRRRRA